MSEQRSVAAIMYRYETRASSSAGIGRRAPSEGWKSPKMSVVHPSTGRLVITTEDAA